MIVWWWMCGNGREGWQPPVPASSSTEEGVVPVDGFAPVVFISPSASTPEDALLLLLSWLCISIGGSIGVVRRCRT